MAQKAPTLSAQFQREYQRQRRLFASIQYGGSKKTGASQATTILLELARFYTQAEAGQGYHDHRQRYGTQKRDDCP